MTRLHEIWREILKGENLEIYAVVVVSIGLLILDWFDLANPNWIFSINVAVLALIAVSLLGNRHRIEQVQAKLTTSSAGVLQQKYPDDVRHRISTAKELIIVGVMLTRTTNEYYNTFHDNLEKGRKIKFLIVEPNGFANSLAAYRLNSGMDALWHRTAILGSIGLMCRLKQKFPENIEIRTIDYVPSFGFYGLDVAQRDGIIYAEHYGFKLMEGDQPKLILRPRDEAWYDLFKNQMDVLWGNAKVWEHDVAKTDEMLRDAKAEDYPTL